MANIMLECLSCGHHTELDLSPAHLSDIGAAGETYMTCADCRRNTRWKAADFGRRSGEDRRKNSASVVPQLAYSGVGIGRDPVRRSAEQAEFGRPADAVIQYERRSITDRRQALLRSKDRVPIQVPMCVRYENPDGRFEEITRTINISPRGVYFKSNRPYSIGATVYITLNYSAQNPGSNIEKLGNVVRVEPPVSASQFKGVAMQFA